MITDYVNKYGLSMQFPPEQLASLGVLLGHLDFYPQIKQIFTTLNKELPNPYFDFSLARVEFNLEKFQEATKHLTKYIINFFG